MTRAEQGLLQQFINELRADRRITPLDRDVAEAMIWKCRKREDGLFQVAQARLAGMARGCSVRNLQRTLHRLAKVGFLAWEQTRVWVASLFKWVRGTSVYRLFSNCQNGSGCTSQKVSSFLLEKEVAHEREAEKPCRTTGGADEDQSPRIGESHCVAGISTGGEESMGGDAQPVLPNVKGGSEGTTRHGGKSNGGVGISVEGPPRLNFDLLVARRRAWEAGQAARVSLK